VRGDGAGKGPPVLVVATLVLAAGAWAFLFLLPRAGLWRRSWAVAAVLTAWSIGALALDDRLATALGPVSPATIGAGVGVGAAWLVATHVGNTVLCRLFPSFLAQVNDLYRIRDQDDATPLWSMAGAVTAMAVAEELVFRGVLQAALGVLGAVVAYTAVQAVERKWALALAALLGGLVWGLLAWWTDGLVAPIVAHVLWTGTLTFLWPLRGCDAADRHEERTAAARTPAVPPTLAQEAR
jgi:membrane protease YdiL (CAAX protease family)